MALDVPVGTKLKIKLPIGNTTNTMGHWNLYCRPGELVIVIGKYVDKQKIYEEFNLKVITANGHTQYVPDWAFDLEDDNSDITDWL